MENCNLQNAKSQLAALLVELREKRANPFKGSPLEALTDEIRELRESHRLSYKEIAAQLISCKIATTETEVANFCRRVLKRRRKSVARRRPATAR